MPEQKISDSFLKSLYSIETDFGFPLEASTVHTEGQQHSQVLMNSRTEKSLLLKQVGNPIGGLVHFTSIQICWYHILPLCVHTGQNENSLGVKFRARLVAEAEAEAVKEMRNGKSRKNRLDALEGHPVHGWDQEAILRHVFGMLDRKTIHKKESNGMLSFEQVVTISMF